jgi:[protein-PII] uridylyltransferase
LRTIEWLATLKGDAAPRPDLSRAAAVISSVRCFLHYRAAVDRNLLDFDAQAGLTRQKFRFDLRDYFRGARLVFHEARNALEQAERNESGLLESFHEHRSRLSNQDFSVVHDHVLLRNPAQLTGDPSLLPRLLEFIARHGVPPSPETEHRLEFAGVREQPLWSSIKTMLAAPHASVALRVLQDTGLMRALLPEWDALEGVVIPDSEYRYTLDEQTLRNVEAMARIEHPQFAVLLTEIDDVSLLVFALLFAEMGAEAMERARAAAVRMEMPPEARETVESQLRHRSALASAMTGRDLDDPATVRQLAERVGTIERLRLLAMLTCARVAASSTPETVSWRLEQLWRAYAATRHELHRELETDRIEQVPDSLPANAGFVKGFPQRYLRAHSPSEIASHLALFEQSQPSGVAVKIESIVARDRPALFASFAGAMSSFGLDILKAEAFSNTSGVILDIFVVADPKRILQLNPTEADRLRDLLQRIALGRTDAHKLMRGRGAADAKHGDPPRVAFDSDACPTATLVEIDAEDRPGLLYSLASVFSSSACNIDIVLVDTKGRRAIDVFYVAHEGQKLPPEMQQSLKEKLLAAC